MADPSGAPPQPGPNDVSTAILRPRKSPNQLMVDEAATDGNSVAALNPATMEILGLFRGDTIIVRGKKRCDAVLICLSSDGVEEGRIQVNEVARNNLHMRTVGFRLIETDPSEFRTVAQDTVIHTEGDPVKREEEESSLSDVGYNDIGGCRRQMAQICEPYPFATCNYSSPLVSNPLAVSCCSVPLVPVKLLWRERWQTRPARSSSWSTAPKS
ncbi:transitional endoplasmic reticulum ATPase-like protein [Mycena galericulata]|nr:transitional endoplasmic reticulum ATPase-like protein [Mycena galericulata]KAJ7512412.1 transitional endoplasmic reticulum ATPase-like protein [Mycena galericulata]